MKFVAVCNVSNKVLYETESIVEILKFKHLNYTIDHVDIDSCSIGDTWICKKQNIEMTLGIIVFNPFLQKKFELIKIYENPYKEGQTLYEFLELNPSNVKFPTLMVTPHAIEEYPLVSKGQS